MLEEVPITDLSSGDIIFGYDGGNAPKFRIMYIDNATVYTRALNDKAHSYGKLLNGLIPFSLLGSCSWFKKADQLKPRKKVKEFSF